jgi:hypothetical protein
MKVKVGGLELPQVQEVATFDRRSLAEQKAPGMAGTLFQNMGRHPTGITLCGIATGPKARDFVERLNAKFQAAKPVSFTVDIVTGAGIAQMLIADFAVQDIAGKPERFVYGLSLREYINPASGQDHSALNAGIRSQGRNLVRNMATNLTKKK